MAARANDFVEGVGGLTDIGAAQSFGVTSKTVVEDVFGWNLRESDDGGFAAAGVDVGFAGSVTAFASGPFNRFLTGGDGLKVRVLVEPADNVGLTSPANGAPHVVRLGYRLPHQPDGRTVY